MKYPAYSSYKETSVDWFGKLPSHWSYFNLKRKVRFAYGDSLATDDRNDGEYSVFGSNGKIGSHDKANTGSPVIIIGRKGSFGKVVFSNKSAFAIDTTYFVDVSKTDAYLRWVYYILKCLRLDEINKDSAVPGLSREDAYASIIPVPPRTEQKAIARFLDHKTAQIDALIAKKEKLLHLLEEKRTALITRAVTKGLPAEAAAQAGLDPNVRMKDSGIEWLGKIPAHWEVKRVKHIVNYIGSGKTPRGGSEVYVDDGIMLLRSQNVHDDGLRLEDVVYIDERLDQLQASTRVQGNDVLLNITGASIGRCSLVPEDLPSSNINQHVCIIRSDREILPTFLHLLFCSKVGKEQIFSLENGTSREGLNFSQAGNLVFAVPLLDEQKIICEYVTATTKEIMGLCKKTETAISKLKEYRTALITAAVTGKIDVRKACPELSRKEVA